MEPAHICTKGTMTARHGILYAIPTTGVKTPEVDSFSIKSIPDNDAKILALKNGEVDFISGIKNVSAESYDEISQTEGFGAQIDDKALQTYYVGYNLNDTVFGDSVIRKAIASAIDKDAVADSIYGGLHDRADSFFSTDLPYCDFGAFRGNL